MSDTTPATTVPRPRLSTSVGAPAAKRRCASSGAVGRPAAIYQLMHGLSPEERAEVLHHLQRLASAETDPRRPPVTAQRWVVRFLALCCFALIPWTIGLALTLPRSYLVGNWPLAWTGFDVILLGCLATTAWSLWKQRQVAVPAAMVTSVLLLCDAWFDILTAHGGRCLVMSIATAVLGEVPIAILLGVISVRLVHTGVRVARGVEPGAGRQPLWRTPLVTSAELGHPERQLRSGGEEAANAPHPARHGVGATVRPWVLRPGRRGDNIAA
jgi:hypothetical protein